ncbi:MAG TPA: hypothetical protein QF720_05665 [Nitrospinota bacterium]|nr:hypothetical protein [Nitrospinota bacterium]
MPKNHTHVSQLMRYVAVSISVLFVSTIFVGCSGSAGNSCQAVGSYKFMMTFHSCDTAAVDCSNPKNHEVQLAGSDDGVSWSLLDEFTSIAGSVPDIVSYNDLLYLFHTGTEAWATLNSCLNLVDSGTTDLNSSTDTGGFVDPSMIVSGSDLLMFYLPGVIGGNPAGCETYPCTKEIHSAVSDGGSPSSFTQIDGNRASKELSAGGFSDPDILKMTSGTYILYVSNGQNTMAYTGSDINGTFSGPSDISVGSGGVPGAIESDDNTVWVYVTTSVNGIEVIRRGTSSDGVSLVASGEYETVIDHTISPGFTSTTSVSSPSIIRWPSDWIQ